jgi:DNA polymerase-3 subunit delta
MSAYIFLGPELGKKQDALDNARKKYPQAEMSVFYAGETNAGKIADTLQNMGLFSPGRFVIVKNAELIKKKDEIELLASCIKELDKDSCFVLLSDEFKLASALEAAVPVSNRQVFYEMFEREKTEWLRQLFSREGYDIEKNAVTAILELVENNTAALKTEGLRLMSFLPKTRPVTAEDVEKWLAHNREESAFTLFSRIAAGDITKALESMTVMLGAKESAQSILAALAWCFRKLGDYLSLLETSGGTVDNFELKKIGLSSPKAKDDYAAAARRYNAQGVEACLAATAEYDILLRSPVAALENILMDKYIITLFKYSSSNHSSNYR